MKAEKWAIFVLVLTAAVMSGGDCFADDEDFQYWSKAGVYFDINKDWRFNFEEEFRLGDDAGELSYHHFEPGFVYRGFADCLDFGFNYRQAYQKDSRGKWSEEHQPNVYFTLRGKFFGLDMSDRSRLEYRDRENNKDVWRYRNKLTLKLPLEFTELKLKPYVADEVFVTVSDDNIDRNRLYGGVSVEFSENIKGDVYYLWQSSRTSGKWTGINVVGTSLKFYF
ncbi:MAG: DUF2490 domain-containing protein [Planctomycetota bacterium]|nr:MAG: DUF2490 domain-containing protein [Planctomycetota bacterium]